MNKREQGFGHVVAILAVVVVLAIGLAGWRVWDANKNKQTTKESTTDTTNTDNNATAGKKTYSDPVGKFTVEYPIAWTLKSEVQNDDPELAASEASLTSPTGTELRLSANWGGKGGMCEPAPGDVPFAKTNTCVSWEYLSSEDTGINNVYYPTEERKDDGSLAYTYKNKADIRLVTMRFGTPGKDDEYLIGLQDATPNEPVKVNDPQMGFNINTLFINVYGPNGEFRPYIYAYATGDSEAFLTSADAMTIKEILRTLRVDI
ncbi:MAG: hypothetical protein KIH63_001875 [Candidatus Saccharibacteria bacterium]|nr:hypothetical protein [Candidatus Saccharibacteria bacterium]